MLNVTSQNKSNQIYIILFDYVHISNGFVWPILVGPLLNAKMSKENYK